MARPVFNLNLFSNVASADPARCLAGHAGASFLAAFDPEASHDLRIRLFCDPNPHPETLEAWIEAARAPLPGREIEVVETHGLADGYRRSIEMAEGDFACQLEHDFVFLPGAIGHRLGALVEGMAAHGIDHLRFNKRWNRAVGYDHFMTPQPQVPFPCCRVSGRSNNPHLVDVAHARARTLQFIPPGARKAEGLEGVLDLYAGGGHVYGALGHPAAVGHLDGRARRWRDGIRRRLWLARQGRGGDD
ncbi:hypothetical protein [uncultured Albimonas sp.]|uniref:hypothetical protein n=1 Tax=uncultured Albimonas sp. TaxID=1331701 RepID=UPI0030ED8AB7|tara:strand:+ start:704 stop:1441 length:738 start_codon:yes stop_codon:yes gene_type:complete